MKRRTNLIFFVLVIDQPTNDMSRSRNGEALFFLFHNFFFIFFFFFFFWQFLKGKQNWTNQSNYCICIWRSRCLLKTWWKWCDVNPLICPFRAFLILKPNFKSIVSRYPLWDMHKKHTYAYKIFWTYVQIRTAILCQYYGKWKSSSLAQNLLDWFDTIVNPI